MGYNPINLDNIFEEDDHLSAWVQEREDFVLTDENNFVWLPEELLNESDNEDHAEETEGVDMDHISPTLSNEESVRLPTSSDDNDGNDPNTKVGEHQNELE
ncbi:hypothetical protein REPUB_Repub04eG0122300 [Reevesia pubescens]